VAAGTFGTFLAIPLCYLLSQIPTVAALCLVIVFIMFSIRVAGHAEKILNQKDPQCIVIDEIAGFLVTLLGLPFNAFTFGAGFFVFRCLDVLKPFPIRNLERSFSGGTGIVMDDVLAGVFSNLIVRGFILIMTTFYS